MRVSVPIAGSLKIVDTQGRRKGFSLQNPSSVDLYYSDDQRLLDSVTPANLPTVGHLLPAAVPVPPPVIYSWFVGQIYIRSQSTGAQAEVMVYEVDSVCP